MPLAQTIRRWLWRLNGVMALLVLVVCTWALLANWEQAPIPVPAPEAQADAEESELTATWDELVAVFRPFYGDPDAKPAPPPPPPSVSDGRLPLRAFLLACFYRDPDGNHGALLRSKDPAHPEVYVPGVGRPHKGVVIERVWEERGVTHVAVRRSEETFTFQLVDLEHRESHRFRVIPRRPAGATTDAGATRLAEASDSAASPDVKLVPFYGEDGKLRGGRVTGIRPESKLARAGLQPGDVVVELDGERTSTVDEQRSQLRAAPRLRELTVLRGPHREIHRLALGG